MNMNKSDVLLVLYRIAAISAPLWVPLLVGYSIGIYSQQIERISRTTSEGSVAISGIAAITIGFITTITLPTNERIAKILLIVLYLFVAPFVLFFSGWGGMLASGYGF